MQFKGAFIIYGQGEGVGIFFLTHYFCDCFSQSYITCIVTVLGPQQQHKGMFYNIGGEEGGGGGAGGGTKIFLPPPCPGP